MKTVTYSFRSPPLTEQYLDAIYAAIESLDGTIEDPRADDNWDAQFVVSATYSIIGHRRLVSEQLRKHTGIKPVIVRTRAERQNAWERLTSDLRPRGGARQPYVPPPRRSSPAGH